MTLELTVFLGYGSDARADTLMIQRLDRSEFTQVDVDQTASALNDADAAASEIARLKAELAKYVGWEPTVREEYEHAVSLVESAKGVVDAFDRGDKLRVNQFVADLKHALEM